MDINSETTETEPSYFAQKLVADPDLAARCKTVATEIRQAGLADIKAGIRSEQIGPNDLGVRMYARAIFF